MPPPAQPDPEPPRLLVPGQGRGPPPGLGDLYGKTLEVEFLAKLREERRFAGVEELRAAIRADVEAALALR
ncbi:MAG: riboflavin kinase [Planctomycetes bacterium]|nr:riboflavin kinase [Planctomycetota bacterium]